MPYNGMRKTLCILLALGMAAVMCYSGAELLAIDEETKTERRIHAQFLEHKPEPAGEDPLAQLRAQNPDIIGWITVPATNIDYPIVQAKDNLYYLRRDLKREPAAPGTIFMDCRSPGDGSGYSVIYGHHMKSGAMFGTLKRFGDKAFFDAHPEGQILFEDGWHTLRFFAFLIVGANDSVIYSVPQGEGFLEDIAGRAIHYRETDAAGGDRIAALSTCSYEFQGARMVLLGKIT